MVSFHKQGKAAKNFIQIQRSIEAHRQIFHFEKALNIDYRRFICIFILLKINGVSIYLEIDRPKAR